jgi:hypothetical protein
MDVIWILVNMIALQTTVYSLLPLAVIFIFIVAAAGVTRGTDIFQLLGIGAIMGVGGGMASGGVGRGMKAANPRGATAKMAGASRASVAKAASSLKKQTNPKTKETSRGLPGFSRGGDVIRNKIGTRLAVGAGAAAFAGGAIYSSATGKPRGGSGGSAQSAGGTGTVRLSTKSEERHLSRRARLERRKAAIERARQRGRKPLLAETRIKGLDAKITATKTAQAAGIGGGFLAYRKQRKYNTREARMKNAAEIDKKKRERMKTATGIVAGMRRKRDEKLAKLGTKREALEKQINKTNSEKVEAFNKEKKKQLDSLDIAIGAATGKEREKLQRQRDRLDHTIMSKDGTKIPGKLPGLDLRGMAGMMWLGAGTSMKSGKRRIKTSDEQKLEAVKKKIDRAAFGWSFKNRALQASGPRRSLVQKFNPDGTPILNEDGLPTYDVERSTMAIGSVAGRPAAWVARKLRLPGADRLEGNARYRSERLSATLGKMETGPIFGLAAAAGREAKRVRREQGLESTTWEERKDEILKKRRKDWEGSDTAKRQALSALGFKPTELPDLSKNPDGTYRDPEDAVKVFARYQARMDANDKAMAILKERIESDKIAHKITRIEDRVLMQVMEKKKVRNERAKDILLGAGAASVATEAGKEEGQQPRQAVPAQPPGSQSNSSGGAGSGSSGSTGGGSAAQP